MEDKDTYWNEKGRYTALYDKLYAKLVPEEGNSSTIAGEMLRVASSVYYDIFNNGGGNLNQEWFKQDIKLMLCLLRSNGFDNVRANRLKAMLKKPYPIEPNVLLEDLIDFVTLFAERSCKENTTM